MRIYSMIYIVENIVPILAATVAAFGFGGLWFGVLPAIVADHHLAGRPFALTLLQAGHWGGAMVVMAVVLQATGVSGPSV